MALLVEKCYIPEDLEFLHHVPLVQSVDVLDELGDVS